MINLNSVLHLQRPLIVFDLETTGTNPLEDRIFQIAITMHRAEKDPITWVTYINPTVTVPDEVIALHYGSNGNLPTEQQKEELAAELEKAHTFRALAPDLARKALTDVDFAGHHVSFDLRILRAEMRRAGVMWDWEGRCKVIDTLRIYQMKDPRTLDATYARFTGKKLLGAHHAGRDVAATEEALLGQLLEFADLPRTVAELHDFCFPVRKDWVDSTGKIIWRNGEACLGFGKHSGIPLRQIGVQYLSWITQQDFPADTRRIVSDAMGGKFPTPK